MELTPVSVKVLRVAALMVVSILAGAMQVTCGSEEYESLSNEPFVPFELRQFKPSHIPYEKLHASGALEETDLYYHAEIVEVVHVGDEDGDGQADTHFYIAALFGNMESIVVLRDYELYMAMFHRTAPSAAPDHPWAQFINAQPVFEPGDLIEVSARTGLVTNYPYVPLVPGNLKHGDMSWEDYEAMRKLVRGLSKTEEVWDEAVSTEEVYLIPEIPYASTAQINEMHRPDAIMYCRDEVCPTSVKPTFTPSFSTPTQQEYIAKHVATVETGRQAMEYNAFLAARRDAFPDLEIYTNSLRNLDKEAYELEERVREAQQARLFTYQPSKDELQAVNEQIEADAKSIGEDVNFWAIRVVDTCERLISMRDLYEMSADDFTIDDQVNEIYVKSSYARNAAVYREFYALCADEAGYGKTFAAFMQDFSDVVDIAEAIQGSDVWQAKGN